MKKIRVKKEGRKNVWLVEKEEIVRWLNENWRGNIHNFLPASFGVVGADWPKKSVIREIKKSERIAILTGDHQKENFRHALSVIVYNELKMFDIGEITEKDLKII